MTEIFRPPLFQVENSAGVPLSGAKLYVYEAGTTTLVSLWQDDGLSVPQANPVIADATGMFPAFWLDEATYKVVLTTSADVTVKTVDDITAAGGGGAGGSVFADNVFFISGSLDATKLARFEADGLTTATTRTYTLPNKNGTVAMTSDITTAVNAANPRRNRIANPANQISTVNGNTAGTTNGYVPADGVAVYRVTSAGTITVQRVQSVTPKGSRDRTRITITVADASLAAGEYLSHSRNLTGNENADLQWGTASAKQIVDRFLFKGPAGTYAASYKNYNAGTPNRSYVALFTPAAADTDEVITIVVPGDASGTWETGTNPAIVRDIVLACGSTFQGTTGWQAGNILGTSAVSNGMGVIAKVFEIAEEGLYLDPDSTGVAPAWELPSYRNDSIQIAGPTGLTLLTSGTVSAAAQLDIVLTSYTGYKGFLFLLREFIPATDNVDLWMRFSTDAGVSFDAGASAYKYRNVGGAPTTDTKIVISGQIFAAGTGIGSGAAEGTDVDLKMLNYATATQKTRILGFDSGYRSDDIAIGTQVTGFRDAAQDTDAVRFLFSSGNITSGKYAVYGYV